PAWLHRVPREATPDGMDALVHDLDDLARAQVLLGALGPEDRAAPTKRTWSARVLVTEPGACEPRPLGLDEILPTETLIYVELRHLERARPTLYVNVLEHSVDGHVALLHPTEPAGVQLVAPTRESAVTIRWVGRARFGRALGLSMRWPSAMPRLEGLRERIIVVASPRPLDLRNLLESPPPPRHDQTRGRRAEPPAPLLVARERETDPNARVGAGLRLELERFAFELRPA
ncbi:MAG: hypothetical protein KDK70_39680, partial [Myxococcales bacterium]|nr:hypothetical protein [Myxococcales bacterium]